MSIAPDSDRQNDWWYEKNGETCGPVSRDEIRKLVDQGTLPPDTSVWSPAFGDEWRPFIAKSSSQVAEPDDDPRWRPVFAKFDQADGFIVQRSWLGLLFGPLYYFYLRLWRKGLVIIGLSMCISTVLTLVLAIFDAEIPKAFGFATNAFCGVFAKYDFYRFKRFGERMWPPLKMFRHPLAIAALYAVPVLVACVSVYADDSSQSQNSRKVSSARSEALASTPNEEPARVRTAATGQLKESWYSGDVRKPDPRARAAKACQEFLQNRYGQEYANKYDDAAIYTFHVNVSGGGVDRHSLYFGGHQFMIFNAQAEKYLNGHLVTYVDIPDHVCVLTDDFQVIDTEIAMKDGLR